MRAKRAEDLLLCYAVQHRPREQPRDTKAGPPPPFGRHQDDPL